jgi:hypothetical protein
MPGQSSVRRRASRAGSSIKVRIRHQGEGRHHGQGRLLGKGRP